MLGAEGQQEVDSRVSVDGTSRSTADSADNASTISAAQLGFLHGHLAYCSGITLRLGRRKGNVDWMDPGSATVDGKGKV
jgi:hypothetical protein